MIRLACLLGLIALVIAVVVAIHPSGWTAILFVFVGMPALALAVFVFGVKRWREGALSWNRET